MLAPYVSIGAQSQPTHGTPACANPWTSGFSTFLAGAVALGAAGALAGYFVKKAPVAGAGIALPLAGYLYNGLSNKGC
jgi:hypothetical protein